MANWNDPNMAASGFPGSASAMDQAVDAGLRSYMLSVYNYMASGVLLTGVVAMLFSQWEGAPALLSPALHITYWSPGWYAGLELLPQTHHVGGLARPDADA